MCVCVCVCDSERGSCVIPASVFGTLASSAAEQKRGIVGEMKDSTDIFRRGARKDGRRGRLLRSSRLLGGQREETGRQRP